MCQYPSSHGTTELRVWPEYPVLLFEMAQKHLPQILCLHGRGTSADIFSAQTRHVRLALKNRAELIFVQGDHETGPGPGVAPIFLDSGPFFSWLAQDPVATTKADLMTEMSSVSQSIVKQLEAKGSDPTDIVGLMGFSQGSIIALMLLLQAQLGDPRWANVKIGVLVCGAARDELMASFEELKIRAASVHVHGLEDPFLPSSKRLTEIFDNDAMHVIEFAGGHHMPQAKEDNDRIANLIMRAVR